MNYPILKTGSRGKDVLALKALLTAKGFHAASDDQTFYKETAEIVATYQATHLGPNGKFLLEEGETAGVAGPLTWRALEGEFNQRQGAPAPGVPKGKTPAPSKSPRRAFIALLSKWYRDGVREFPKGSNSDKGGIIDQMQKFHGMSGQPWCAMTINFAHHLVFGSLPPWGKVARVASIWNTAMAKGLAVVGTQGFAPGDLGIYLSAGLRKNGTAPDSNGHIFTITAPDNGNGRVRGLDGNSDDRMRASERGTSYLVGYIRLFPAEPGLTIDLFANFETGKVSDR